MCAQNPYVSTTTPPELLGTSLGSGSTFVGSMERNPSNVRNAARDMLFILIGRPMPKPVAQGSTDVIVEPSSLGFYFHLLLPHNYLITIYIKIIY